MGWFRQNFPVTIAAWRRLKAAWRDYRQLVTKDDLTEQGEKS